MKKVAAEKEATAAKKKKVVDTCTADAKRAAAKQADEVEKELFFLRWGW